MPLPPWLIPADLVGAASRGAQAGLSIRSQDMAAAQHAAQLALEEDRINLAQQQSALNFQVSQQRAAEALREHNALEAYRLRTLEVNKERLASEEQSRRAARALTERGLNLQERGLDLRRTPEEIEEAEKRRMDYGAWTQEHRRALLDFSKAQDALNKFQSNPMTAMLKGKDPSIDAQEEEKIQARDQAKSAVDALVQQGIQLGHLKGERATLPGATKTSPNGKIRVRSPDGKTGNIPAEQLEAALAEGYTRID